MMVIILDIVVCTINNFKRTLASLVLKFLSHGSICFFNRVHDKRALKYIVMKDTQVALTKCLLFILYT